MMKHSCVIKTSGLFGPCDCGREGVIYDRARKGWLCPEHSRERLCEFCQYERAWGRVCYHADGKLYEAWLCVDCLGVQSRP
jgi:hypothetical protein